MAGDIKGCKKTKHKTPANRVVQVVQARKPNPLKRKAGEELHRPTHARCSACFKSFYLKDNHDNACSSEHPGAFHPAYRFLSFQLTDSCAGQKAVNHNSELWADYDESARIELQQFVDDPDYESGMMWDCCNNDIESEGCCGMKHIAVEGTTKW